MSGIMFAARGLAVSFSVFVMVYCVLSLAVSFGWRVLWRRRQRFSARGIADLLFAFRMLPLLAAAAITAAFTVPSFLLLEPRSINEPLSVIPTALGLCGVALGVVGVLNASVALRRASRTISTWMRAAQPIESSAPVPLLRISSAVADLVVPPMTAVGIAHPKVLLSGAAESMLTADELQAALNHELAHVRRRDNLKKLLLRFVAFPAMTGMEAAWLEATEMASDDAAVSSAGEALDLASALIKLSRLTPVGLSRGPDRGPGAQSRGHHECARRAAHRLDFGPPGAVVPIFSRIWIGRSGQHRRSVRTYLQPFARSRAYRNRVAGALRQVSRGFRT